MAITHHDPLDRALDLAANPQRFRVGQDVVVTAAPEYVKTAEPMPMLRPGSLVTVGEIGRVIAVKPLGTYAVQFVNGSFLLDQKYLGIPQG